MTTVFSEIAYEALDNVAFVLLKALPIPEQKPSF
jgi:hypothetical protein